VVLFMSLWPCEPKCSACGAGIGWTDVTKERTASGPATTRRVPLPSHLDTPTTTLFVQRPPNTYLHNSCTIYAWSDL